MRCAVDEMASDEWTLHPKQLELTS
jgi:hypothetical protein